MLERLKRSWVLWQLWRLTHLIVGIYQPPFKSVGHSFQCGRITEKQADDYIVKIGGCSGARKRGIPTDPWRL